MINPSAQRVAEMKEISYKNDKYSQYNLVNYALLPLKLKVANNIHRS